MPELIRLSNERLHVVHGAVSRCGELAVLVATVLTMVFGPYPTRNTCHHLGIDPNYGKPPSASR